MTDKAYKNHEFLMGPEARSIRLLAEYLEPRNRFEKYRVNRTLIFFGSARLKPGVTKNPDGLDYYDCARQLAAKITRWTADTHSSGQRYHITTGGGPGIMEAGNRGSFEVDPGYSIGLNISLPFEQHANEWITERLNFEFHYFFMRKFWFLKNAEGMAVFPGGFGTMDELFEVLTLIQTGKKHKIPVLLFGEKFWKQLINFDLFVEMGLISPEDIDLLHFSSDVDEAFDFMRTALSEA